VIQLTDKAKNERLDAKMLHLSRKYSTICRAISIARQISLKREPITHGMPWQQMRIKPRRERGKRLPRDPAPEAVAAPNVLHVIKFQVADNTIYVTLFTEWIIN
jgi:hypothetical protein